MDNGILREIYVYGADILKAKEYQVMQEFIQHGKVNCMQHCICVAVIALLICRKLRIICDEQALVRGALLHDYFLYDWHEKKVWHTWHGFRHARTARVNAEKDFILNETEKEIIEKHMWPLNPALPSRREVWIVTAADKYCSTLETLGQIPPLRFLQGFLNRAAA